MPRQLRPLSMPRLSAIGLAARQPFVPSRKMPVQQVAVVVPSPATSEVLDATSRTICAPMFSSGSCSFDLLRNGHAVLRDEGAPNFFSITALRPFGPSVIFTGQPECCPAESPDVNSHLLQFVLPLEPTLLGDQALLPRPNLRFGLKPTSCRMPPWPFR